MKWVMLAVLLLAGCTAGFQDIVDSNEGETITIIKLTGNDANLFAASLQSFCPNINEDTIYRVQISGNKTITKALDSRGSTLCEVDANDPEYASKAVAVLVNNEPVYLNEIQTAINSVPQEQRGQLLGTVIDSLVNQKLLIQIARTKNYVVTNEEIDKAITDQVSLTELEGKDLTKIRELVSDQLKVQMLLSEITNTQELGVSEAELQTYYETNADSLMLPESWTIRHIQFKLTDRGEESDLSKAQTVFNFLETTDFCDLVTQFSDDDASIGNCGRYSYESGQMLPSIEEQVKKMEPGQVRIIKSEVAFHILNLESKKAGRLASYEEVKEQIQTFLAAQKKQSAVNDYINEVRVDAEIISYLS